ncbi:MAG: N-acetylornithine carbamoyltransferase [Rhodothermales bacterium]
MPHLLDWHLKSDADWWACIDRARHHYRTRVWTGAADSRSLGLLFFNASLRTRTSMELAGAHLGAHVTTLNIGQGTWGFEWAPDVVMNGEAAEHIREAVGVLSRYYDALGVRVFASGTDYARDRADMLLHTFAEAASVPIINLESAFYHPCQALADASTILTLLDAGAPLDTVRQQVRGQRFVLSWAPHPKPLPMAVPNSALLMAARLGMNVTVARPEGFALDEGVMAQAQQYAAQYGTTVDESTDQAEACKGAHVVYAKAWGGQARYTDPAAEAEARAAQANWTISPDLMARTDDAAFMHCLPVRRGVVVADAVLDGPHAQHLLQAEFRLHAQKAILEHAWDLS